MTIILIKYLLRLRTEYTPHPALLSTGSVQSQNFLTQQPIVFFSLLILALSVLLLIEQICNPALNQLYKFIKILKSSLIHFKNCKV